MIFDSLQFYTNQNIIEVGIKSYPNEKDNLKKGDVTLEDKQCIKTISSETHICCINKLVDKYSFVQLCVEYEQWHACTLHTMYTVQYKQHAGLLEACCKSCYHIR